MDLCVASEELKQKYLDRIPSSEVFDGIVWPGNLVTSENIMAVKDKQFDKDDLVIASYHKSGTIWTVELMSAIALEGDTDILNSMKVGERAKWIEFKSSDSSIHHPLISPTKQRRIWITHLPVRLLPTTIQEGNCKLVYVSRNSKDQSVSCFHFHKMATALGRINDLTWDEFFRLHCSGSLCFGSWFDHVLDFWKFTQEKAYAKFIFFEDMKSNLEGVVKSLEEFVGMSLTEEKRAKIVDHCSFDSMKENQMTNRNGNPSFDQRFGKFMRKGIVGDWKNYFTVAQNEAFDKLYKTKMAGSGLEFKFIC